MPNVSTSKIARRPRPEDAELILRRAELATLRAALAFRETELDHLRAQLNSFEGRYIRQVGVLYIQLDDWEDRIANLLNPPTPQPATESENTIAEPESEENIAAPHVEFQALKALFREVAKRIHPDRAANPHDELHRTHLMAQANAAFLRDDAAILARMLHGYDPATDSGDDLTLAAQLARIRSQIVEAHHDLLTIAAEIEALHHSEMADLQTRTAQAALDGRDLLAELAARVKGSIGIAMRRYELDLARIRRKQPAFNPEPLLTAERAQPQTQHSAPKTVPHHRS
ncbi:MAG: hypothetical protein WBY53_10330 [Acidobacteriaceae bacterium]